MSNSAISIKGLTKQYASLTAVNNLNLTVSEGEIYGFLGPNGAGKSTTLRMLLTLIKPTAGSIDIFGKSLLNNRKEALANMGCIIEKPDFYMYLTASQNLSLLAKLNGVKEASKRIAEVMNIVGLTGRENHKVQTYSHGMKQRLGIAQALLHNPQLIVLDEPTTGLDPQGIIELRYLLLRLKHELGKTVVLSSHILSEVELIADSMVIMNKGKAMAQGKVGELLNNEELIVKIEVDDTEAICKALRESAFGNAITKTDTGTGSVSLKTSRTAIPELNHFLAERGIRVYGISYQRPLEEYFLKITQAVESNA